MRCGRYFQSCSLIFRPLSVAKILKKRLTASIGNGGTDIHRLSDTLSGACASDIFLLHFLSNIVSKDYKKKHHTVLFHLSVEYLTYT